MGENYESDYEYRCLICDTIHQCESRAEDCCEHFEAEKIYYCEHCSQEYRDEDDVENCCNECDKDEE